MKLLIWVQRGYGNILKIYMAIKLQLVYVPMGLNKSFLPGEYKIRKGRRICQTIK